MKKLLVRVAIEKAISFEERAYRFYESALKRSTMRTSFDLLKQLLSEELKHRMRLEEIQKSGGFDTPNDEATEKRKPTGSVSNSGESNRSQIHESSGRLPEQRPNGAGSTGIEAEKEVFDPDMQEETDDFCAKWPAIPPEATAKEMLLIALRKERCGYLMYSRLKDRFIMKSLRDVYAGLAKEESGHIRWIEGELKKYRDESNENDHQMFR